MAPPRKVMINACLTGMVSSKLDNPDLPVSVQEIIEDALSCAQFGASIIHLHARDDLGTPTWKKEVYGEIIRGIRTRSENLIICVSTSGRLWSDFERRTECLELEGPEKPDMASLTPGSLNFMDRACANEPEKIKMLAAKMARYGVRPELEIFEPGMLNTARYMLDRSILPSDNLPYFNLFFGSLGTSPLSPACLAAMLSLLPDRAVWGCAGIGRFHHDAILAGLAFGGHIRVGLEDTLFFDRERRLAASNRELVDRAARLIALAGHEVATPREAREILGLDSPIADRSLVAGTGGSAEK